MFGDEELEFAFEFKYVNVALRKIMWDRTTPSLSYADLTSD